MKKRRFFEDFGILEWSTNSRTLADAQKIEPIGLKRRHVTENKVAIG